MVVFAHEVAWIRTRGHAVKRKSVVSRREGTFPLVLIVHGNHLMNDYSDPGYEYLGRSLASKGYIFVSVDENFLNFSPYEDLFLISPR